jgi:hypothetical protein
MNVDEFQALLEAASNKSKIRTSEHFAMISVSTYRIYIYHS